MESALDRVVLMERSHRFKQFREEQRKQLNKTSNTSAAQTHSRSGRRHTSQRDLVKMFKTDVKPLFNQIHAHEKANLNANRSLGIDVRDEISIQSRESPISGLSFGNLPQPYKSPSGHLIFLNLLVIYMLQKIFSFSSFREGKREE